MGSRQGAERQNRLNYQALRKTRPRRQSSGMWVTKDHAGLLTPKRGRGRGDSVEITWGTRVNLQFLFLPHPVSTAQKLKGSAVGEAPYRSQFDVFRVLAGFGVRWPGSEGQRNGQPQPRAPRAAFQRCCTGSATPSGFTVGTNPPLWLLCLFRERETVSPLVPSSEQGQPGMNAELGASSIPSAGLAAGPSSPPSRAAGCGRRAEEHAASSIRRPSLFPSADSVRITRVRLSSGTAHGLRISVQRRLH